MKGWKKICRNTMIAMVSAGALMSVPVPVLAYVDASAEETKVFLYHLDHRNHSGDLFLIGDQCITWSCGLATDTQVARESRKHAARRSRPPFPSAASGS